MPEQHHIAGRARGEPMPHGRVGACVHVPLSGTPSEEWGRLFSGRLTLALSGRRGVGHLRVGRVVRGNELVFEGVEEAQCGSLGSAVRAAVDAVNRAMREREHGPEPRNMEPERADRIARTLGIDEADEPVRAQRREPATV